jgi:hypothetical protein
LSEKDNTEMMKKQFFILLVCIASITSCKKSKIDIAANTPTCIRQQIEELVSDPNNTIGSVDEYTFQNTTVYAFSPDIRIIADGSTAIRDATCKNICSVGGFGGPSINLCNGENFFQKAVLIRNIWKKN